MLTMVEYHVISEDEQRDEAVELQRRERSTRSKFDTEGGVHAAMEGKGQIPNLTADSDSDGEEDIFAEL